MGSITVKVGLGLALPFCLVQLLYANCIFGPQDSSLLKVRNNTILAMMNSTLISLTNSANNSIGLILTYTLWSYLQRTYLVTPANCLNFVSMGKLHAINWTQVTAGQLLTNQSLASYIKNNYVIPVHEKLQETASTHSFSLGIFRPKQTQFNFTGITVYSNATFTTYAQDTSCMAGSSFVWQAGLDLPYVPKFNSSYSFSTAVLATMMENAFENYYRKNTSPLNTEFVRANFIRAFSVNGLTTVHIETYFLNTFLRNDTILNSTPISKFPIMTFADDNRTSSVTIIPSIGITYIINASYSSVTDTSSTSTEVTSTSSTISSTTLFSTSTLTETSSTSFTSSPSISDSLTLTAEITDTTKISATSQTSTISVTATVADTSLSLTFSTKSPESTTITDIPTKSTLSTEMASTPASTASSNATRSTQPTAAQNTSLFSLVTSSEHISTGRSISSTSTGNTVLLTTTNPASTVTMHSVVFQSTTIVKNSSGTSNISRSGNTSNPDGITGTGNTVTASSGEEISRKTTFDVDPFFKANVPVITKVYNDEYLLKFKFGTMAPITEKWTFFAITLPAAFGMIAAAVFCMICWQVDCLRGRK